MKRKLLSILFALVLVLSFSLVMAVPTAASRSEPEEWAPYYFVQKNINGLISWAADPAVGSNCLVLSATADEAQSKAFLAPPLATLNDLVSISVWHKNPDSLVYLMLWVDFGGEGSTDFRLVAELPKNSDWTQTTIADDTELASVSLSEPIIWETKTLTEWKATVIGEVTVGDEGLNWIAVGLDWHTWMASATDLVCVDDVVVTFADASYAFEMEPRVQILDPTPTKWGDIKGWFSKIQVAIDAASPDDTIIVAAGTYAEAVLILGKPLKLLGEPGAIIKPDENTPKYDCFKGVGKDSDRRAGIYIYQVNGVIIDGFEIDGTGTDVHYGIIGKYSDGSIVRNCVVHDIVNKIESPISDVAGVGIMFYNEAKAGWSGAHGVLIERNVVYKTGRMGIFVGGWTSEPPYWLLSSNNVIEDNEVYDTWQGPTEGSGGALTILGASGSLIQRNEIYNNIGLDQSGISILGLASDTNRIIQNEIYNNYVGIKISAGVPELHYNNISGNAYGVKYLGSDKVNATNNWWGSASGPRPTGTYESYGDKVSANVDYEPWLLEEQETAATYDKTLALKDGWTLISTDKALSTEELDRAWVGTDTLADSEDTILAYKYTAGFWDATLDDLEPLNSIYVKTKGGGGVGINYAEDGDPAFYSKELEAGWNLISIPSMVAETRDILSPLHYVTVGTQQVVGLTTLVSQGNYNQFSGDFYKATLIDADWETLETLIPFDGYWASMEAADTFEVPIP